MIYPISQVVKIIDFGLSQMDLSLIGEVLSPKVITLWYRPIELFLGHNTYGSAVDAWSCG